MLIKQNRSTFERTPRTAISRLWLIAILLLSMLGSALGAQEADSPATEEVSTSDAATVDAETALDEEAAHDALRALRAIYEEAVNENNVDLLRPYLDDEFTGVMVTGELVESFTDLETYWRGIQEQLDGGTYVTELDPDLSWIHNDIAVAKGTTKDLVTTARGTDLPFTTRWTAVLIHRDGVWKLRRIQGTMNPVENVFVEFFRRQAVLWTAVLAVLAGLALGFFVGRRVRA